MQFDQLKRRAFITLLGARPRWLVAAMKKGRKLEDFLIKRRS
jgi:hypothetical protein